MGDWTALAEQLAAEAREPGFGAAAANAAACRARVDPAALRGLVGAALALTDYDALPALWAPLPPCPDAATLVSWAEELEAHVAALLLRCGDLGRAARAEHDAAARARAETEDDGREAAASAADCAAALEVLGRTDQLLRYARDMLRSVPADLGEAYEAPARLTAAGGRMPHSGDFIVPPETAAGRGAA